MGNAVGRAASGIPDAEAPQNAAFAEIAGLLALENAEVSLTGADPVFPTPFRIGAAGAAALAASAVAAADLWANRGGRPQHVGVELAHAAASLRSGKYFTINGMLGPGPFDEWTDYYPVRNGRYLYLQNNAVHHRRAFLSVIGRCENKSEAFAKTLEWDGNELETAVHAAGGVAGFVRTAAEWESHPQGRAVRAFPLLEIERIGEGPKPPATDAPSRPLEGIRVLDLTRVIAGPICGRTLASHGAEVLRISAAHVADIGLAELETGIGKLSTRLDLRHPDDRAVFDGLLRDADVLIEGYRPGALAAYGLTPESAAARRPGLVYVDLSAWGPGPWAGRRGYDSAVQAVSGMALRSGSAGRPKTMPVSAIDYVTGYLLAAAVSAALVRRQKEGGSWLIRASLARVGMWISDLGTLTEADWRHAPEDLDPAVIEGLCRHVKAPDGRIRHLGPIVSMSQTEPRWDRPPAPLAYHQPEWPRR